MSLALKCEMRNPWLMRLRRSLSRINSLSLAASGLPTLVVSFAIALIVFAAINLASWQLDRFYPWEHSKWKRFWLQLLVGVFVVAALAVLVTSFYFSWKGNHISNTAFFDTHFFMMLGYIVMVNMYYHAEAIVAWRNLGKIDLPLIVAADPDPALPGQQPLLF